MHSKSIKAGIAALALLVAPFAAEAADMPVKARPYYKGSPRSVVAYHNWTGFYLGGVAGYGWGTSHWDFASDTGPLTVKPKGWMFGVTGGYNWQAGSFVYGIEADYNWSDVKGSGTCGGIFVCETKNTWLATFRGRVGYAFDRWLPYITAGGAYGDIKATTTDNPPRPGGSATKLGWTVGGGLEYAFLGNWSAKIEYLYVDLGKFDCGSSCGLTAGTNNISFSENVIRAGLNYKFSGPVFSRF
jgi:outer membrane immunogenic protein